MSNFPHTRFNHLKCCWLAKIIASHSLNCHERVTFCPFCGNSDVGIHQFPGRLRYRHRGCSQMIQKHRENPTCSESSEEVWLRLDRIGIQSIALWSVGRSDQRSASERQSKYLGKKNCWWESMSFAPCSCKMVFLPTSLLCFWTTGVPHLLLQTLAERCHWPFCRKTSLADTKMIHWIFKTRRIEECAYVHVCVRSCACLSTRVQKPRQFSKSWLIWWGLTMSAIWSSTEDWPFFILRLWLKVIKLYDIKIKSVLRKLFQSVVFIPKKSCSLTP